MTQLMRKPAITCENIKKSYGSHENQILALRGINLEIYPGELTLIVGPSGSGKSTLLSIITTILTPDEGQLSLLGRHVAKMSEQEKADFRQHHLGIVFQSLFLIPTLTVAENVALPLIVAGEDSSSSRIKALEYLGKMKLEHRADVSPATLSKGQQQRVAIARAIINQAEIIVCDEPTSALDHVRGTEVMEILQVLAKDSSRAIIVVTHDHRIFSYADRIICIDDGQVQNKDIEAYK